MQARGEKEERRSFFCSLSELSQQKNGRRAKLVGSFNAAEGVIRTHTELVNVARFGGFSAP